MREKIELFDVYNKTTYDYLKPIINNNINVFEDKFSNLKFKENIIKILKAIYNHQNIS